MEFSFSFHLKVPLSFLFFFFFRSVEEVWTWQIVYSKCNSSYFSALCIVQISVWIQRLKHTGFDP